MRATLRLLAKIEICLRQSKNRSAGWRSGGTESSALVLCFRVKTSARSRALSVAGRGQPTATAERSHNLIDRFRCRLLVGAHGDVVVEAVRVTQLVAAAGEAEGSALEAAIASDGFPPLQFRHGAVNTDEENPGAGFAQNAENFILPFFVLEEVVDDEIRAQFEMMAPAPVNPGQQVTAVRIEDQPQPGTSPVRARRIALIDVFPRGASIVGLAGNQT